MIEHNDDIVTFVVVFLEDGHEAPESIAVCWVPVKLDGVRYSAGCNGFVHRQVAESLQDGHAGGGILIYGVSTHLSQSSQTPLTSSRRIRLVPSILIA